MISNKKVDEYFIDYTQFETFTIQTPHAVSEHEYTIQIPCLKTFKAPPYEI